MAATAPGAAPQTVAVVVLGDVGRSPRMQYHCSSLASLPGTQVELVGYKGEECVAEVENNPHIRKHLISSPFARAPRKLFLLWAPLKVAFQLLQLFWALLFAMPRPSAILVQNPPSIPALLAVWVAARLRGSRMVIDWHNFGYSILALARGGNRSLLVRVAKAYERWFAGRADAHLCVTQAMQAWLAAEWGVRAVVLYDKAPLAFRRATLQEQHGLFQRLAPSLPPLPDAAAASGGGSTTHMTVRGADGAVSPRAGRPFLLVSSTSWTEDEDFGLLLDALQRLDERIAAPWAAARYPDVLVLVTGKGPLRDAYEARMRALPLRRVAIRTAWLEPGDYPLLLGSADAGVCLHTSSSGLDLPMKVVDMFGARTPVLAVGFSCLHELVRHGENGLVFGGVGQLEEQLAGLLEGFPGEPGAGRLAQLRRGVEAGGAVRWHDNWMRNAAPLFAQ